MEAKLLWIEGKRAQDSQFIPSLRKKGCHIEVVSTGSDALRRLPDLNPHMVILNTASMRTSGVRICQSLHESANGVPVLVITAADESASSKLCAEVVLSLPFTTRKLVNRIRPYLPVNQLDMLKAGPIQLDMERKQVFCEGRQAVLTPRLAQLLKTFMERPGEALEREQLFRDVWNTEYTGDTRTLDVHISWLRQAIEESPRKPRYLKTIRGIGYRLDV